MLLLGASFACALDWRLDLLWMQVLAGVACFACFASSNTRLVYPTWARAVYPAWARNSSIPPGHELVYPT